MTFEPSPDFGRLRRTLLCEEPDRVPTAELYVDRPAKEGLLGKSIETIPASIEFYHAAGLTSTGSDSAMWRTSMSAISAKPVAETRH